MVDGEDTPLRVVDALRSDARATQWATVSAEIVAGTPLARRLPTDERMLAPNAAMPSQLPDQIGDARIAAFPGNRIALGAAFNGTVATKGCGSVAQRALMRSSLFKVRR